MLLFSEQSVLIIRGSSRMAKSFLGVHFLQNPNDAITIAELLYKQDIDLVIETGTYLGGAALFFASIMYEYRYNNAQK